MITVTFLPPELKSLDRLRAQVLLLTVFEDERPLRGVAGLLDWRTCGMLSRFVIREHVAGGEGEVVLFPTGGRLPVPRGIAFGLGKAADFDERAFLRVSQEMARKSRALGVRSAALSLPGQHRKPLDPAKAVGLFAEAVGSTFSQITFFAPTSERREMTEELKRRRGEYEIGSSTTAQVSGGTT
jgi:hypothetical protein